MATQSDRPRRKPAAPRRAAPADASRAGRIASNIVTVGPIDAGPLDESFYRADIRFDGVDHAGPSFEVRVFLNNPQADHATPLDAEHGFAGRFDVFGHGGCFGDVGHCAVREPPRPYDPRPAHPLTPARKTVIATEAVRAAIAGGPVMVTAVSLVTGLTELCTTEAALRFESASIVTYR